VICQTQQQVQWQVQTAQMGGFCNARQSHEHTSVIGHGNRGPNKWNANLFSGRPTRSLSSRHHSVSLHGTKWSIVDTPQNSLLFLSNFRRSACRSQRASSSKRKWRHWGRLICARSRRAWCDRPRASALRFERTRASLWLTTAEERNNSTVTVSNSICLTKMKTKDNKTFTLTIFHQLFDEDVQILLLTPLCRGVRSIVAQWRRHPWYEFFFGGGPRNEKEKRWFAFGKLSLSRLRWAPTLQQHEKLPTEKHERHPINTGHGIYRKCTYDTRTWGNQLQCFCTPSIGSTSFTSLSTFVPEAGAPRPRKLLLLLKLGNFVVHCPSHT